MEEVVGKWGEIIEGLCKRDRPGDANAACASIDALGQHSRSPDMHSTKESQADPMFSICGAVEPEKTHSTPKCCYALRHTLHPSPSRVTTEVCV